jgi:hypothetical protein
MTYFLNHRIYLKYTAGRQESKKEKVKRKKGTPL